MAMFLDKENTFFYTYGYKPESRYVQDKLYYNERERERKRERERERAPKGKWFCAGGSEGVRE